MHLTDEQIREMARHAATAGETETAKLCDLALKGDKDARSKLERVRPEAETPVAPA